MLVMKVLTSLLICRCNGTLHTFFFFFFFSPFFFSAYFTLLILKNCHLGTYSRCGFSGLFLDLLNKKLKVDSAVCFNKPSSLQCRRPRFDPWVGKIPWRREWLPTLVFLPGECHGQRSLAGYSAWDCKDSDTTE